MGEYTIVASPSLWEGREERAGRVERQGGRVWKTFNRDAEWSCRMLRSQP